MFSLLCFLCLLFLSGIANTLFMLSAMSAVSLNFVGSTQKVVLAVTVAAGSIGGVPYPYLLRYVCDNFGLQWTFLIAGLAVSVTIFLALLWSIPEKTFETRTQNGHNATVIGDNNKDTTHDSFTAIISDKAKYHKSICNSQTCQTNTAVLPSEIENWRAVLRVLVCNVPFILFIVGQALAGSTFRVLSTILTDVLRERGFSSKESTVAFMVFNFTGIPGRLLTGVIEKIPRGSSLILVSSLTLIASPAVIGMNFVSNHVLAILACGTGGLAFGAVHASIAVSTISLVKEQHYSPAVGIAYGLTGIIVAITGPLSGMYFRNKIYINND